jgi:hypothetical protein
MMVSALLMMVSAVQSLMAASERTFTVRAYK